jgi:hypothetical protein
MRVYGDGWTTNRGGKKEDEECLGMASSSRRIENREIIGEGGRRV